MNIEIEAEVRAHMDGAARALRAKDLDALMGHYADDVAVFDVRPPLQVDGAAAYRRNFTFWFAAVDGPIDYEVQDQRIAAGETVAVCHSLCRVRVRRTDGGPTDYAVRLTSGLVKADGAWRIVHEHVSMPLGS